MVYLLNITGTTITSSIHCQSQLNWNDYMNLILFNLRSCDTEVCEQKVYKNIFSSSYGYEVCPNKVVNPEPRFRF